jgi:hypothetical protein
MRNWARLDARRSLFKGAFVIIAIVPESIFTEMENN